MLCLTTMNRWLQSKQVILLLLLILAIGISLRIYDLGMESLWYDEVKSIYESAMGLLEASSSSNQPPLYFIILRYWINIFGTSEIALRSLSVIFGIASILLIYQIGSTVFNNRVGLISSFLLSISHFHIQFSQEARGYTLFLLLSIMSYYFFIKILKDGRKLHYFLYFLATLLVGYTHVYGLFLIASQIFCFLLLRIRQRRHLVSFSITILVTIIALLPLGWLLGHKAIAIAGGALYWLSEPDLLAVVMTLARFAGHGPWRPVLLLGFLLCIIIGFFTIKVVDGKWVWKQPLASLKSMRWSTRFESVEETILLIVWLFLPILIGFAASLLLNPMYTDRYLICTSPALYLLTARGISKLNPRKAIYSVLILIAILSGIGLQSYYTEPVKGQWREAMNIVEVNSEKNDAIIYCDYFCRPTIDYYYQGELTLHGIGCGTDDLQEIDNFVNGTTLEKDRVWLILCNCQDPPPIWGYLENRYGNTILEGKFKGVSVLLYNIPVSSR